MNKSGLLHLIEQNYEKADNVSLLKEITAMGETCGLSTSNHMQGTQSEFVVFLFLQPVLI